MTRDTLIEEIRLLWQQVLAPAGDPGQWDDLLAAAFPENSIFNWTDFQFGKAHTYEIILHPGRFERPGSLAEEQALMARTAGERYSILLKLSAVAPYYLARVIRRAAADGGQIEESGVEPATPEQAEALARVRSLAEGHGFAPMPREHLEVVVPEARLELADPGRVYIYHCLFEDQDSDVTLIW